MAVTENPKKTPVLVFLIVILLVGTFGIVYWATNKKPFMETMKTFLWVIVVMVALSLLIYIIVWALTVHRYDMVHINKQRIIEACKKRRPLRTQTLMMRGNDQLESRYVGKVMGICQAATDPARDKKNPKRIIRKATPIIFIAFKRNVFSQTEIFVGLDKEDYTNLNADVIYLNGMCFAPPLYELYYLSHRYPDTNLIDETVRSQIYRYNLQENLKESKELISDAIAISPRHQKQLERTQLAEIKQATKPEGK